MHKWLGLVVVSAVFLAYLLKEQKTASPLLPQEIAEPDNRDGPSKPPAPALPQYVSEPMARFPEKADAAISPATKATNSDSMTKFTDKVLRDDHGGLQKMSNPEAKRACSAVNMRLPTILELARYAQTKGAKGVMDSKQAREQNLAEGYQQIAATNSDGTKEEFYYNPKGFSPATDAPWEEIYWSSSTCVGCVQGSGMDSVYVLDAEGKIHSHYDHIPGAVRCIQ